MLCYHYRPFCNSGGLITGMIACISDALFFVNGDPGRYYDCLLLRSDNIVL